MRIKNKVSILAILRAMSKDIVILEKVISDGNEIYLHTEAIEIIKDSLDLIKIIKK